MSLDERELIDEVIEEGKNLLRRFISWLHKKLSALEDYLLKKLDDLGKRAEEKIKARKDN